MLCTARQGAALLLTLLNLIAAVCAKVVTSPISNSASKCSLPAWRGGCECNAAMKCLANPTPPCKLVVGRWDTTSQALGVPIQSLCQDNTYDAIVFALDTVFTGSSGSSSVADAGRVCNGAGKVAFCMAIATGIQFCQQRGKRVLISLGGANTNFASDSAGHQYASTLWSAFLGGRSPLVWRPFGPSVVLDGVDLHVTSGPTTGYAVFAESLQALFDGASRNYYLSASPSCAYPDPFLGPDFGRLQNSALQRAQFDYIFVSFRNATCSLLKPAFDWLSWQSWANTGSVNRNVQIMLGVDGATGLTVDQVANASSQLLMTSSQHFGGVSFFDSAAVLKEGLMIAYNVSQYLHSGC